MAFLFAVAVLALALGRPAPALAAPVTMQVALAGAQEVPAVTAAGSGVAELSVAGLTVQFTLSLSGLDATEVTAAHIHQGAADVNGPVLYTLASTGFTTTSGSVELTSADLEEMMRGNLYINVHTTANPGGEVRGQIIPPQAVALAQLNIDHYNAEDVDLLMGDYADNYSWLGIVPGCQSTPCSGEATVRAIMEGVVAGHTVFAPLGYDVSGDVVAVLVDHRNDASRAFGIERIILTGASTIRGGKIVAFETWPHMDDPLTAEFFRLAAEAQAAAAPTPPDSGNAGLAASGRTAAPALMFAALAAALLGTGVLGVIVRRRA
jgi:hypothetical protein